MLSSFFLPSSLVVCFFGSFFLCFFVCFSPRISCFQLFVSIELCLAVSCCLLACTFQIEQSKQQWIRRLGCVGWCFCCLASTKRRAMNASHASPLSSSSATLALAGVSCVAAQCMLAVCCQQYWRFWVCPLFQAHLTRGGAAKTVSRCIVLFSSLAACLLASANVCPS